MVKISVIMLSWNTSIHTIECLKSFQNQTFRDFEIIIVDNGSKIEDYDKLKTAIQKINLPIKLLRLEKNQGISGGMNFGYKFAKGEYLLLMNNDMIVDNNLLKELVKPFSKYQNVGMTIPRINFYDNGKTNKIQFSGGKLTFYGTLLDKDTDKFGPAVYNKEREVYCATGACFMISRDALNKLKELFPQVYYVYFEDIDLSWRIRSNGYKIIYAPKSLVYHKESMTLKVNDAVSTQFRYIVQNKYLTFWRNLRKRDFVLILPFLFGFDILRAMKNILKGNPKPATEFLIGFNWFLSNLNNVKKPRKGNLSELGWGFESIGSIMSSWSKR